MEISKKFFDFRAEIIMGSKEEVEAGLNIMNKSNEMSIAFTSNLVFLYEDKYALLVQTKSIKGRG